MGSSGRGWGAMTSYRLQFWSDGLDVTLSTFVVIFNTLLMLLTLLAVSLQFHDAFDASVLIFFAISTRS